MASYKLKAPVSHGDETYQELTFRKPTVGDLITSGNFENEEAKIVSILSSMAEIPIQAFKKIELEEFTEIMKVNEETLGNLTQATTGA